jgi:hypothetical protein
MINSALETAAPSYFNSSYYSNVKITLKLSNKHAKFKLNYKSSNDESDSAHFYEEWFEIDDLKSTGFDLEFGFKEEDYLSAEQHCHIIS